MGIKSSLHVHMTSHRAHASRAVWKWGTALSLHMHACFTHSVGRCCRVASDPCTQMHLATDICARQTSRCASTAHGSMIQ